VENAATSSSVADAEQDQAHTTTVMPSPPTQAAC